jgi:regulator of sirC expression with transglutaminase-like and TPR domain
MNVKLFVPSLLLIRLNVVVIELQKEVNLDLEGIDVPKALIIRMFIEVCFNRCYYYDN